MLALQSAALEDALKRIRPCSATSRPKVCKGAGCRDQRASGPTPLKRWPARLSRTSSIRKAGIRSRSPKGQRQAPLPTLPKQEVGGIICHQRRGRQGVQDGAESLLEPRVEHGVFCGGDATHPQLPSGRFKERQEFGRAVANILVGQARGLAALAPALPWVRHRLVRPGFILGPERQAQLERLGVGVLDQLFFAAASGSTTSTTPLLRLRKAVPVGHQERVRPKRAPAWTSAVRMV